MMRLSKRSSTMTLVVIIGILLVVLSFFPVGKAIAKMVGIITTDQTTQLYHALDKVVKEVGAGTPSTRMEINPVKLKLALDEDSAIMGFSAQSKQIEVKRSDVVGALTGASLREGIIFQRPAQCGGLGASCLCICKEIVHDPVMGYSCRQPKQGEAKDYVECDNELGVDFVSQISQNDFVGDLKYLQYDQTGGFIIGRFTKNVVISSGKAGGLVESSVFDAPEKPIIYVEKSQADSVAVCFKTDACLDENANQNEKDKQKAVELYNKAEKEFRTNTPESLNNAAIYYEAIFIDQKLVDGLRYANEDLVYLALFNSGMTQYRLGNYQRAVEILDLSLLEMMKLREGIIPAESESQMEDMIRKEKMRIDCDFARKDCSCYYHYDLGGSYWDECKRSTLKCYKSVQKDGTEMCSPCSQVRLCSDYAKGNEFGLEKPVCQENFCKLSPGCRWSDGDMACMEVS